MSPISRPLIRTGIAILAGAWAAACVDLNVTQQAPILWDAQLTPAVGYPDLAGQGAAVSQADGTNVGIAISGAQPGAQHAWGLRIGTCAVPGQQIGLDAAYPVLAVDSAGGASVQTHLGASLAPGKQYHIAVRLSASDTTRVACGDLMER